jgi:septum formation protein
LFQSAATRPLILASASPRRQYLLREAGFEFTVRPPAVEEHVPPGIPPAEVAAYLAGRKAQSLAPTLSNEVVLASDTVVIIDNTVLNKPANRAEAIAMLQKLSGRTHSVITGVCLLSKDKTDVFQDETRVTFKPLSQQEIEHYIDTHHPYDKAGAYGAQDWIGMVAITRIEGSYFTVMGLPMHLVYQHLQKF